MRGDSLKERILRVATIEEVVAAYVPLQRSGAGYVGLCPFHADKHPSLHVHPGKQFFKCFACGEGGDLFAFVQKIEGCSFTEAMGKLAKRYSIDSREWTVDNYAGKKKRTDGKGTDGKGTAGSPDKTANENSDDQLSVVNSQLSIRTIGAANRLFASLLQPYVPEDEALRETYRLFGVGIAPPEVPADYRKMRSRLIFPIRDEKGGLVAFAARRRTDGEEGAKYVNSPASPVYSKSRVLYALDLAGEAIRERRFVFVTEGYKDALAMHAAGFTNTVALCGVAFTAGHLRIFMFYYSSIFHGCRQGRRGVDGKDRGDALVRDRPGRGAVGAGLFVRSEPDAASLRRGPGQPAAWIGLRLFPPSDHRFPSSGLAGNLRTPPASADCKDRERFISLSFM